MIKVILLTMMMVTVLSIGRSGNSPAMSMDLSQFKWKNRLLILFAPDRKHPFFDKLNKALIARKADAADRELVIFKILESGPSCIDAGVLAPQIAQSLREKFDIAPGDFTLILVGKDGGIKLNRRDQTELADIFALIDSMPMRQQEMRQ